MSTRKKKEFREVVEAALADGYEIVEGEEHYENQRTKFTRRCLPDFAPPGGCPGDCKAIAASKVKHHQSHCRHRASSTRRIPWETVVQTVKSHPAGIELLSTPDEYRNQNSLLRLRCLASGHLFELSYQALRRQDNRRSGCPYCARGWSETLALFCVSHMLGRELAYEQTPQWLTEGWNPERGQLRFDGLGTMQIGETVLEIAVEHQGEQHTNENHWQHTRTGNPKDSFAKLHEGDCHKKLVCVGNRRLIAVPDLTKANDLQTALNTVATAIKMAVPEHEVSDLIDMACTQLTENGCERLFPLWLAQVELGGMITRLRKQARHKGLELQAYDPIKRKARTLCPKHGLSDWRSCTGGIRMCRECYGEEVSKRDRLSYEEVKIGAQKVGWVPLFDPPQYVNQRTKLIWQCAKCGEKVERDYLHIKDRPHAACLKRETLYEEISRTVKERGDTIITETYAFPTTNKGEIAIRCTREGGCNQVFSQRLEKIKLGQMHGCDKFRRAAETRSGKLKTKGPGA